MRSNVYRKFGLQVFCAAAFFARAVGADAAGGCMDSDNNFWIDKAAARTTYDRLMSLMTCPAEISGSEARQVDAVSCSYFLAKALGALYDVQDFSPQKNNGKWFTANEIIEWVRSHKDLWTKLGKADDQATLVEAAKGAANGQPVVAAAEGSPHGHVAIILAGELKPSTTWKGPNGAALNVPNSAAFSLDNASKAYVFCRLSAAFSKPADVEIYFRVR